MFGRLFGPSTLTINNTFPAGTSSAKDIPLDGSKKKEKEAEAPKHYPLHFSYVFLEGACHYMMGKHRPDTYVVSALAGFAFGLFGQRNANTDLNVRATTFSNGDTSTKIYMVWDTMLKSLGALSIAEKVQAGKYSGGLGVVGYWGFKAGSTAADVLKNSLFGRYPKLENKPKTDDGEKSSADKADKSVKANETPPTKSEGVSNTKAPLQTEKN